MDSQLVELRRAWASKYERAKALEGEAEDKADPQPFRLAVLSWNVWFEYEKTFADRMRELGALVGSAAIDGVGPSALALQELTGPQQALLRPQLSRLGFSSFVEQTDQENGYWCALATRKPLGPLRDGRWIPFACGSMMSRGLVMGCARLDAPGSSADNAAVVLASTHLESFVGEDMRAAVCKARKEQLVEAGRRLEAEATRLHAHAAVLFGDMNWDERTDGDATKLLGPDWLDAWEASGRPASAQYTYDGRQNGMLAHSFRNRLDRCFIWLAGGAGGRAHPARAADAPRCSVSLVGTSALGSGLTLQKALRNGGSRTLPLFPSDHFGLLASFELGAAGPSHARGAGSTLAARTPSVPPSHVNRAQPSNPQPSEKRQKTVAGSADEPIELE